MADLGFGFGLHQSIPPPASANFPVHLPAATKAASIKIMIFTRLFVLLALSGADALKMTAPASRRAFLSKAAAAVPLAVAAPVFAAPVLNGQAQGAMAGSREKYMTGQFDASAAASRPMTDGQRKVGKNPFQGSFSDPAHSGMTRTIAFIGGRDYQIDGMDV